MRVGNLHCRLLPVREAADEAVDERSADVGDEQVAVVHTVQPRGAVCAELRPERELQPRQLHQVDRHLTATHTHREDLLYDTLGTGLFVGGAWQSVNPPITRS